MPYIVAEVTKVPLPNFSLRNVPKMNCKLKKKRKKGEPQKFMKETDVF